MSFLKSMARRWFGAPTWDANQITDEWYRAHFNYAADVVQAWLSPVLDLRQAELLNFGCGDGITDLGLMLRHGATRITGVDIRAEYERLGRISREQLGLRRLPNGLHFKTIQPSAPLAAQMQVDAIMSWSTFEHIQKDQLEPISRDLLATLKPGGYFFLQIEPLYYSPYGSHLRRYDETPWHHLLTDDEALWRLVQQHQGPIDGAERDFGFEAFGPEGYKRFVFDEYLALNKLTADELVALMQRVGFEVVRQERRQMDLPVPEVLRGRYPEHDLLTNEIFLLLRRPV